MENKNLENTKLPRGITNLYIFSFRFQHYYLKTVSIWISYMILWNFSSLTSELIREEKISTKKKTAKRNT